MDVPEPQAPGISNPAVVLPAWQQRGRRLLWVLLLVLTAWATARSGWQGYLLLLGPDHNAATLLKALPATPPQPMVGAAPHQPPLAADLHLFGKPGRVAVAEPAATAPATSLSLRLTGVVVATPPSRSLALISPKSGGEEAVYGVGDPVAGRATLRRVLPDRVILERNGRLETLWLEEESPASGRPPGPAATSSDGGRSWQVDGRLLDRLLADPLKSGQALQWHPYQRGGRQLGIRLAGGAPELLAGLGLQAGDILYAINNRQLSDDQQLLTALAQLRTASRFTLALSRGGRLQKRFYAINR